MLFYRFLIFIVGSNQFGAGQRLPKDARDLYEKTIYRLAESIQYMDTVKKDKKFHGVRGICLNRHEDCTFWASLGQCDTNPVYMKINCAPACMSCDMLGGTQSKCQHLPESEPLWKPGDLNAFFENIVDNANGSGDYLQYNPTALSRPMLKSDQSYAPGVTADGPWVVTLENLITAEEADRIIEIGQQQGYERSTSVAKVMSGGSLQTDFTETRTSHNTWCQEESCLEDPLVANVIERIANVTKSSPNHSEHLQLLQYQPGQFYLRHHDYIPQQLDMPCGVRIMTLFLYLNDVEEGGGTSFPLLNVTVHPKKGNALLWPSVLNEDPDEKDPRTDHEAQTVVRGVKYGANAWIHSRDFKTPLAMNCL